MEKVLTGAWYNSRTLGIKLPKRENRLHTKSLGMRMRGIFQPHGQPAGSGVDFQSHRVD